MAHESQRAEGASRGTSVVSPPEDAADIAADRPGVSEGQRRTPFLRYALYGLLVVLHEDLAALQLVIGIKRAQQRRLADP